VTAVATSFRQIETDHRLLRIDRARHVAALMRWYHHEHHHSGLALLDAAPGSPRLAGETIARRQLVLDAACAAHPERFVRGSPRHPFVPPAAWINPPANAMLPSQKGAQ
jgi:putative transposase